MTSRRHCRSVRRRALITAGLVVGLARAAFPLSPGTDLAVPAAARTSHWVTDLYLLNPGDRPADVTLHWLVRGEANPNPQTFQLTLASNETRILADVVRSGFGLDRGTGAIRITATEPIVANCRIFATDGEATYGQGFEGVPTRTATAAGTSTHVVGLSSGDAFRTNLYALAGADGAALEVELRDPSGEATASTGLVLAAWQPMLEPVTALFGGGGFDDGTLFVRITEGAAIVGASRIDNLSSDPTTLVSWVDGDPAPLAAGTYYGIVIADTTTAAGLAVRVNGVGEVEGLEFGFPSDRCAVLFSAGQDLSGDPLPLAELAAGYGFSSDYPGGGMMAWTVTLELEPSGPTLSGSIAGTGSGWSGDLTECNGDHSSRTVHVGMQGW